MNKEEILASFFIGIFLFGVLVGTFIGIVIINFEL